MNIKMTYTYFHRDFIESVNQIHTLNQYLDKLCHHLQIISPKDYTWYHDYYLFQVDVQIEDCELYEDFLDRLLNKHYSALDGYNENGKCKTYLVPLFVLKDVVMSEKNYILRRGHYGLL